MFLTLFINFTFSCIRRILMQFAFFLQPRLSCCSRFHQLAPCMCFVSFTQLTFLSQVSQSAHVSLAGYVADPVVCHFHSVHGCYFHHFAGYRSYVLSSQFSWSVLIGGGSCNSSHAGYILISWFCFINLHLLLQHPVTFPGCKFQLCRTCRKQRILGTSLLSLLLRLVGSEHSSSPSLRTWSVPRLHFSHLASFNS